MYHVSALLTYTQTCLYKNHCSNKFDLNPPLEEYLDNAIKINVVNMICISSVNIYLFFKIENNALLKKYSKCKLKFVSSKSSN